MAAMLLLLAVFPSAYVGFACFALSQVRHWRAVVGDPPPRRMIVLALRSIGTGLLGASLALALVRDGPSFGSLLWATAISIAALAVAFSLAWQSGILRPLTAIARLASMPWRGSRFGESKTREPTEARNTPRGR